MPPARARTAALAALVLSLVGPARAGDGPAPKARPDDVKSIDAILAALYDVISGPAGASPDWDRFRALFAPGARLIPVAVDRDGKAALRNLDVEGFIKLADAGRAKAAFYESEVARRTVAFGHVAHVFSTYESRREKGEKPFTRGINSFQLFHDGDRWWVVTIYWDSERPDRPIPAEFLPQSK